MGTGGDAFAMGAVAAAVGGRPLLSAPPPPVAIKASSWAFNASICCKSFKLSETRLPPVGGCCCKGGCCCSYCRCCRSCRRCLTWRSPDELPAGGGSPAVVAPRSCTRAAGTAPEPAAVASREVAPSSAVAPTAAALPKYCGGGAAREAPGSNGALPAGAANAIPWRWPR